MKISKKKVICLVLTSDNLCFGMDVHVIRCSSCCDHLVNSEMGNDHQLVRKLVTTAIPDGGMTFEF